MNTPTSIFSRQHLLSDLLAGTVTFLVAVPLCLVIAMASGAEPVTGLITGIFAGLLVGSISGTQVMISGPAAGLTTVVAMEIAALGSFEALLLAVIVAGVIQIIMGLMRGGFIKSFVPTSVVRGLLSAIGIILILKQIPHLFGHDTDYEGEMSFVQPDKENTFSEIIRIAGDLHVGAMTVGIISLGLIYIWLRWKPLRSSGIPAPLAVVLFGFLADYLFSLFGSPWAIGATHRVQVPIIESFSQVSTILKLPDFGQIGNPEIYSAGLTIALVASLQALLTTDAVDRLDRRKRTTPANRELVAQGFGNIVAGFAGGLPMTCEIVRSSVNIDAGAETKRAAIFHGVLLVTAVLVFPQILNMIPLSCLAAILIATGLRLASPKVIGEMWQGGRYQFVPYVVTTLAIVFTDPLYGIIIGLIVSITFILWSNLKRPMRVSIEHHLAGDVTRIELASQVSFLNRSNLRMKLDAMPSGQHVLIDASGAVYIDPDILDTVREYRDVIGPSRGLHVSTRGFRGRYNIPDNIQYLDFVSQALQEKVTPQQVLKYLLDGNERFRTGKLLKRDLGREVSATAEGQHPVAAILYDIDSRAPAESIFDVGLGEVFSVRVAGNVATDAVLGSLEFACGVAGAKVLIVLGHTRCAAVGAAIDAACHPQSEVAPECPHLQPLVRSITRVVDPTTCHRLLTGDMTKQVESKDAVARRNVEQTVRDILIRSPSLNQLVQEEKIVIVGMLYDVKNGEVSLLNCATS